MVTITIPDSERRSEYAPVASTGPFPVGFPIFDNTGADLSVTLDGEEVSGWTLTAEVEAGFYGAPNVWVNASITFGSPITGALVISGNRAPRRVGQYAEGRGIPARDHNTEYNMLTAVQRELYDRQRRLEWLAPALESAVETATAAAEAAAESASDAASAGATAGGVAGASAGSVSGAIAGATAGASAANAAIAGKADLTGDAFTGTISAPNIVARNNGISSVGGAFTLERPASGTSLAGDVAIDVFSTSARVYEKGGSARGMYIDLTALPAGSSYDLISRIGEKAVAANNLSDLTNAATARGNLGLGDAATRHVGTTAGTVAAGDDPRFGVSGSLPDGSVTDVKVAAAANISATKLAYTATGAYYRGVDAKLFERITPQDFGAIGNGVADDTAAFQAAVNYCVANRRALHLVSRYKLTATIYLPVGAHSGADGASLSVLGAGGESTIYHDHNGHLFYCASGVPAFFTARDFKIVSRSAKTSALAFWFAGGLVRSEFTNIRYGSDGNSANRPWGFFGAPGATITDTLTFSDIFIEECIGVGFYIAQGSTIYFNGGRVIGSGRASGSIGILLQGGNGGVWLNDIDLINLDKGMLIANLGHGSNREIFIKQAAFDGCHVGLEASDSNSYIDITGCWVSAAVEANIILQSGFGGTLCINGGTIFNAGTNPGGSGDGIQINNASLLILNGVHIRYNVGAGIRCLTSGRPIIGALTGCIVYGNGQGMNGQGSWTLSGNFFAGNSTDFTPNAGTYKIRGCYGSGLGDAG